MVCTMPDTRNVSIRNLPEDAYELLRRLMYERGPKATQADIIADALRALASSEPKR